MIVSLSVTDSDSDRVRNAGHLCMDEAMKDHIQSNHGTNNGPHDAVRVSESRQHLPVATKCQSWTL